MHPRDPAKPEKCARRRLATSSDNMIRWEAGMGVGIRAIERERGRVAS